MPFCFIVSCNWPVGNIRLWHLFCSRKQQCKSKQLSFASQSGAPSIFFFFLKWWLWFVMHFSFKCPYEGLDVCLHSCSVSAPVHFGWSSFHMQTFVSLTNQKGSQPSESPMALFHLEAMLSLSATQLHLIHNSLRRGSPTLYLAPLLRDAKLLQALNRPLAVERVVKHFKEMNLTWMRT